MGLGSGINLLKAVGAAADDGEFAVFHQLQLALEVILKAFVLQRADVVLRKIEEQPNGEGNTVDPLLLVRLGGDLHRQVADAVGQGIGEALLQLQAFRRGKVGFGAFAAGVHFHGGKDGGAVAEGGIQNILDEVGGGGFALGAGEPDEGELFGRVAVVFGGQDGKGPADIADEESRGGIVIGLLRHIAGGAGFQRLLQVLRLEIQALADEKGAGGDGPAIVGEGGEGELLRAMGGRKQQAVLPQGGGGPGEGEGVFHRVLLTARGRWGPARYGKGSGKGPAARPLQGPKKSRFGGQGQQHRLQDAQNGAAAAAVRVPGGVILHTVQGHHLAGGRQGQQHIGYGLGVGAIRNGQTGGGNKRRIQTVHIPADMAEGSGDIAQQAVQHRGEALLLDLAHAVKVNALFRNDPLFGGVDIPGEDDVDIFRAQGGQPPADRGKLLPAKAQQRRDGHAVDIAGKGGIFGVDIGVGIHPDEGKLLRGVVLGGAGHGAKSQGVVAAEGDGESALSLGGGNSIPGGAAGSHHLRQIVGGGLLLPAGGHRYKGGIRRGADAIVGEEGEKSVLSADESRAAHGAAGSAAAQLQRGRNK